MTEDESWREKYLEICRRIEGEEARWKALEQLLRRMVSRLCLAADGIDPRLDRELGRLADVMRRDGGAAELQEVIDPLSTAIAALDERRHQLSEQPVPAAPAPPPCPEEKGLFGIFRARPGKGAAAPPDRDPSRINEVLTQLLERMSVLPEMEDRIAELKTRLETPLGEGQIAGVLKGIADLANEQRLRLQHEKHEIERILKQVTSRLEEIDAWLTGASDDQKASEDSTRELDSCVLGEVRQLNASVQEAADLAVLQQQVRSRLEAIGGHFQAFRAREKARHSAWQERAEQMRSRMEELEREAHGMRECMERERKAAMLDALTGISNRLAYDERINTEYKRWKRFREPLSIAVWDVDRFKSLNDRYGHKAGDKVLRVLAQHLAQHVRETDFVARYGGEEFVAVLVGTSPQDALRIMDGVRLEIGKLGFHFRDEPVGITASCGVTAFTEGDTPDSAFDRADKALYEAKKQGRNRCVLV